MGKKMKKRKKKIMIRRVLLLFLIVIISIVVIRTIKRNNEDEGIEIATEKQGKVEDKVAPEINLNGKDKVIVIVGETYSSDDVKAIDDVDGDISNSIETLGEVDTSKAGNYEIIYT